MTTDERNARLENAVNFLRGFNGTYAAEALAIDELRVENARLHHERAEDIDRIERAAIAIEQLMAKIERFRAGLLKIATGGAPWPVGEAAQVLYAEQSPADVEAKP